MTDLLDIEQIVRREWGRLLSSLIAYLRDFELAEDSLQDALESAMKHWQKNGLPRSPYAWLLQTARRKAIDRIRRDTNFKTKQDDYTYLLELEATEGQEDLEKTAIPDERLRLIFTCCHPALEEKTRIALTLRTLGGLTTREIARAFLDKEDAMAQRLVRAKRKIRKARIPYKIPDHEDWPDRLESVLNVLYLIFNEGYAASSGSMQVRIDLCNEAIRLTRTIVRLKPDEPEIKGLLALMLLNHSRRAARSCEEGVFISLEKQDRRQWDKAQIHEGVYLIEEALRRGGLGKYQIQAAISAVHAEATTFAETGWSEIALLYERLYEFQPTAVVMLNYAVALSYAGATSKALSLLEVIKADLGQYQPFYAAKADILRRCGETEQARTAYRRALELSGNSSEQDFLSQMLSEL